MVAMQITHKGAPVSERAEKIYRAIGYIAGIVQSFGGNGEEFAYSHESLDRMPAQGARDAAKDLAELVYKNPDAVAQAHLALTLACDGDKWATEEVAGRFLGLCKRLSMVATIRAKHGARFETLCEAILRARATPKQKAFAKKLAGE